MLTYIGLGLIVFAWLYQLVSFAYGNKKIRFVFVGLYSVGVLVLVVDGFMAGLNSVAYFNIASLVMSLLLAGFMMKRA